MKKFKRMQIKNWVLDKPGLFVIGLGSIGFAMAMLLFPTQWHAPDKDVGWSYFAAAIYGIVTGILFVIGLGMAAFAFDERDPHANKFCEDCGVKLASRAKTRGYSPRTGLPLTVLSWYCPNSPNRDVQCHNYKAGMNAKAFSSIPGLSAAYSQSFMATFECGHDPREIKCGQCLDAMVRERKLTPDEADLLR